MTILRRRCNVIVARENNRQTFSQQRLAVRGEAFEPFQLIFEFRARLGIAVWQINTADENSIHRGFDVTALVVAWIARQRIASQDRLGIARQDGDPIPCLLPFPDCSVAGIAQHIGWKGFVRRLQFLKAHHIGAGRLQPLQQVRQAAVDVVDVEGGDFHRNSYSAALLRSNPRQPKCPQRKEPGQRTGFEVVRQRSYAVTAVVSGGGGTGPQRTSYLCQYPAGRLAATCVFAYIDIVTQSESRYAPQAQVDAPRRV